MRKPLLLGAALAFAWALAVLPATAGAQQPPMNWSGVYVGVNIGGIINHDAGGNECFFHGTRDGYGCADEDGIGHMNPSGFLGGAQLGWNWQTGSFVIGPEIEYDGVSDTGSTYFHGFIPEYGFSLPPSDLTTFTASESITSLQSERVRVGWALGSGLVYLTGGWAQGNVTVASNYAFTAEGYPGMTSTQREGTIEGIGGEWAIARHVSMKAEVLDYNLQPISTMYPSSFGANGYTAGKDFYFHGQIARLGFNWRF